MKVIATADGGVGDLEDEGDQRQLVDAVAEQADDLADPERRERAIEGEADVRVVPGVLEARRPGSRDGDSAGGGCCGGRGCRCRRCRRVHRDRRARGAQRRIRHADAAATQHPGTLEDRCLLEAGRQAGALAQHGIGDLFARWEEGPGGGGSVQGRHAGRRAVRRGDARAIEGRRLRAGGYGEASGPGAGRSSGLGGVDRIAGVLGDAEDGGEQEEGQARGEEQVADRGDVLERRQRERDQVAQRPEVEEELAAQRRGQRGVQDGAQGPAQPGRLVGREPHRHVPAVDHDHERVARDADEREREARVGAVLPQRDQQEAIGQAEEREPQLVDDRDVVGEEGLGPEAEDHAEKQEREELEPDVREPLDPPAQHQAEQQPERDSGDQHAVILGPAGAARPSIAPRRGPSRR